MSKSNGFETNILKLVFQNVNLAAIGDATGLRGSTAAGSLYVSLHTADPGEAGDQTTNEAAYTGYARAAVVRSSGGWTVAGNQVSNAAAVGFPACTGGSAVCTHFGIGTDPSGAGSLLYSGQLGSGFPLEFTGATNDNVTVPGHSFSVDDRVGFYAMAGSALPTGIVEGTLYWIKTVAGDVVTVSATQGGATLDITASGAGVAQKDVSLSVSNLITPSVAIGQLALTED